MSTSLALAGPGAPLVDPAARTISGLVVPFGCAGQTSAGHLTFAAGQLTYSRAARVKLLREHVQRDSLGLGRSFDELDAVEVDRRMVAAGHEPLGVGGLWATFHVPPGDNGDLALAEAANGVRDAFSVGVQLDEASATALRRANGSAVAGRGLLREVSLVSVPAFDDARVGSVAATNAELVVTSWSTPTPEGTTPMTTTATEPTPTTPPVVPTPAPTDPAAPTIPAQPVTTATAAPLAVHGAALVTAEASTYGFSADGPSLVVDAWNARTNGDGEAASRLHRYNAELTGGNVASQLALAAVFMTDNAEALPVMAPNLRRPDLMRLAIDRGRPIMSRLSPVPIKNAQPFLLPVEGEFEGVADHVEGTAHAAEGTLTMGDATMAPKALSGAFRLSREIVDSSNPAIDRIALRAMLRDYRRKSEARVYAALIAAAGAAVPAAGPNALDAAILGFGNDDSDQPDFLLASKQAVINLATYLDGDGRQLVSTVNATNSVGSRKAGGTGYTIGGVDVAKSASVAGTNVLVVDADGILVAESPTQTFRFDEVEGPGVIKLALFGYFGAAVLDPIAVELYSVAASA